MIDRVSEFAKAIDMSVKMTSNHAARSLFALNNAMAELSEGGKALGVGTHREAFENVLSEAGATRTAKKMSAILSKLREVNEQLADVEKITRDMVERATNK